MPTITKIPKRKSTYEKHDKNAEIAQIYNTSNWKKLRLAHLMQYPLCEHCLENGIITPATQVHHIREISNGSTLEEMKGIAFDPKNLQSLCEKCHRQEHLNRSHS